MADIEQFSFFKEKTQDIGGGGWVRRIGYRYFNGAVAEFLISSDERVGGIERIFAVIFFVGGKVDLSIGAGGSPIEGGAPEVLAIDFGQVPLANEIGWSGGRRIIIL